MIIDDENRIVYKEQAICLTGDAQDMIASVISRL